jgi:hypothetical protein
MANPEHVAIAKSGTERWNARRQSDHGARAPDLSGADLKGIHLPESFVIADITNPSSSPLELQATVPDFMIPFVPILRKGETPSAMFANLQNKYDWVMDVLTTTRLKQSCRLWT